MLKGIAYRLFIVLMFLVGGTVEVSRQRPVQLIDVSLPEDVMPGQVLPRDAFCEWQYFRPGSLVYCRVWRQEAEVNIAYNRPRIIETVYHPATFYTLGQLVLSHGDPNSLMRQGNSYTLYWADGSAVYVYASVLRPTTPILLVLFGAIQDTGGVHSWRGFANNLE